MMRKLKLAAALIAILFGGTAGFILIERIRGQRAVRNLLDQMAGAGAMLDTKKLAPPAPIENAAPGLLAAGKDLPDMREAPPSLQMTSPGRVMRVFPLNTWTNTHQLIPMSFQDETKAHRILGLWRGASEAHTRSGL